ncbi:F-BAR domain only protein 2 isoform X1 [Protopterus annectens]|uniref:F-BAR domain only protein 2 isoform X1 n=1 Tax=Protopterus annectens TaxID=7888 RepID=UPI001CFADC6C|nr:F-BAR domain only protein 2 isoform X1 [Protopterus annectens]
MITAYFLENFWGEKNNGFDVLYHNMKHGQTSTKELSDFIRERAGIEDAYARAVTKLAKSVSNYSQLGTFAPVWDIFKASAEKFASCHFDFVRKLHELIKEIQKYAEEQTKAHRKTKEEVAATLESVQNIQTITQALQKYKEIYNTKCLEQERLKKEGATQKEMEKAASKTKKATEVYKLYVEKYATAKMDFEQKMTEAAQKFQDIEEAHMYNMKEIILSFSQASNETHSQISQVQEEFLSNIKNTTPESLIQKFAETKGTGKERPGPIEFEECNLAIAAEGLKPRKRKPFGITGRIWKDKDTDSVECPDADSGNAENTADVDEEGYSIKPEVNQSDAKENHFCSSSDSDSDNDEPRKFHVEIKPLQPNDTFHSAASLDQIKTSIGNITLSPAVPRHSPVPLKRNSSSEELGRLRLPAPSNDKKPANDLLSLDSLFGLPLNSSSSFSTSTAEMTEQNRNSSSSSASSSSTASPWGISFEPSFGHVPDCGSQSLSPEVSSVPVPITTVKMVDTSESLDTLSLSSWCRSQWISFNDEHAPVKWIYPNCKETEKPRFPSCCSSPITLSVTHTSRHCPAEDASESHGTSYKKLTTEEIISAAECFSSSFSNYLDISIGPALPPRNNVSAPGRPTTPLAAGAIVPPPRPTSRPKLPTGKLGGITEIPRPFSPSTSSNASPPPAAPLARAESTSSISSNTSLSAGNTPTVGVSRGPSPVTLGNFDTLPVAVALTESVNAYFKGADPAKCIVKITGEMTMSFPVGIIKVFTSNPSPAVLSLRLRSTRLLEQILPNSQLLCSDSTQSDPDTKDFWINMQSLATYLRKMAEQNSSASYFNVELLKYQVSSYGIQSTPLNLATYWKCTSTTTDVRVDYKYNPESMVTPSALSNIQVLVPVDGGVTNMQSLPPAVWNAEQMKALWRISEISNQSENEGSGTLRAKFDISDGPSKPATLAVQFVSEGSTLSGVDMELVGTGYRLSLLKKRFASGRYMADC